MSTTTFTNFFNPTIRSRSRRTIHFPKRIAVGDTVLLQRKGYDYKCIIVTPQEADPEIGLLSAKSPLGKAILGKKEHQIVNIKTPLGHRHFKIMKISNEGI
jgi:transcription elongation factor GreA